MFLIYRQRNFIETFYYVLLIIENNLLELLLKRKRKRKFHNKNPIYNLKWFANRSRSVEPSPYRFPYAVNSIRFHQEYW